MTTSRTLTLRLAALLASATLLPSAAARAQGPVYTIFGGNSHGYAGDCFFSTDDPAEAMAGRGGSCPGIEPFAFSYTATTAARVERNGLLHASASLRGNSRAGAFPTTGFSADAAAGFQDVLLLTPRPGAPAALTLVFDVFLHGRSTATATNGAFPVADGRLWVYAAGGEERRLELSIGPTTGGATHEVVDRLTVPLALGPGGRPLGVPLSFDLLAQARALPGSATAFGQSFDVTADFGDTAGLVDGSVRLFGADGAGAPTDVTAFYDARFSSQLVTPEPATATLVGGGLLALAGVSAGARRRPAR